MSQNTFKIEVTVDFRDHERNEAVYAAVRDAARTILTVAMMLQDKRPPKVEVERKDFIRGVEKLSIDEPEDANV